MLDLETSIVSRYRGEARLQRLAWVAAHWTGDPAVQIRACQLLVQLAQQQGNIPRYKEVFHFLQQHQQQQDHLSPLGVGKTIGSPAGSAGGSSVPQYNSQWVQDTEISNREAREILTHRLAAAKSLLNKEAIRMAYLALAEHDMKVGEIQEAFLSVLQSKDYCTSRTQTAQVSLYMLQVTLYLKNYATVRDYVTKLDHTLPPAWTVAASLSASSSGGAMASSTSGGAAAANSPAWLSGPDAIVRQRALIAAGLERLAAGDYDAAATHFRAVACSSDVGSAAPSDINNSGTLTSPSTAAAAPVAPPPSSPRSPDTSGGGTATGMVMSTSTSSSGWDSVLAPEEVAMYATLLSLAVVDSREVLVSFAEHPEALAPIPMARQVLLQFAQRANYQLAWQLLESSLLKTLEMDLYMSAHVPVLRQRIRERSLVQYWQAYQRVELSVLASSLALGSVQHSLLPILVDLKGRQASTPAAAGTAPDKDQQHQRSSTTPMMLPADTRIDLHRGLLVRDSSTAVYGDSGAAHEYKYPAGDDKSETAMLQDRYRHTQNKLSNVTNRVLNDAYSMLVRLSCLEHELIVSDPSVRTGPIGGRHGRRGGGSGKRRIVGSRDPSFGGVPAGRSPLGGIGPSVVDSEVDDEGGIIHNDDDDDNNDDDDDEGDEEVMDAGADHDDDDDGGGQERQGRNDGVDGHEDIPMFDVTAADEMNPEDLY